MKVNIDVDLAQDVDALRSTIVKAIAQQVLYGVSYDEDYEPHSIPTQISRELRDVMAKAVRDEAEKAVGPAVQAALAEGVQLTNQYGEARGDKVPLREVIVDEAKKALGKKIEIRDNYGRSESMIQQIVRDEVQRAMADDLKEVIKAEREKVQLAVREQAAAIITESVRRAAHV